MMRLRVMAWNIAFAARKTGFITDDAARAQTILDLVDRHAVDVVAVQEMANRQYETGTTFNLVDFFTRHDDQVGHLHFEPTLSLGQRHSYPYGKLPQIRSRAGIIQQEQGLGLWIRSVRGWTLRNLYADAPQHPATVEVQRPLPHPLYMGDDAATTAGRDEEDRLVLWARLDQEERTTPTPRIYLASLHLPTLKGEEKGLSEGIVNDTQYDLARSVMGVSLSELSTLTVDDIGSAYRSYALRNILAQALRIEQFWEADQPEHQCVFILAGDFNFQHTNALHPDEQPEQQILRNYGFQRAKVGGFSRPGGRLVDNIWVRGAKVQEYLIQHEGRHVSLENLAEVASLEKISDHYPVVADIVIEAN